MTRAFTWREWMSLPWLIIFFVVMLWTPKTRKRWYVVLSLLSCQLVMLLYAFYSK